MASLADLSAVVNRLTGGNSGTPEHLFTWVDNRVGAAAASATVSGRLTSLWRYNAAPGGQGAVPTSAAVPDNTTSGGLMQTNPGGGRQKWLLGGTATASVAGVLVLYDRLLHCGGLSGTVTTAQTVGGTLTRNTGGAGNQIWVEIYTAVGTTATTITASYTNQSGTSGRTTKAVTFGGTNQREGERILPLPLQDGDTGVQAVASVTVLATTTTAGNFGVTVARPLLTFPLPGVAIGCQRDLIAGLPEVKPVDTNACLAQAWMANTTIAPTVLLSLSTVEA